MSRETKKCTKCGQVKLVGDFYRLRGKPRPHCKACFREWHRQRYATKNGATDDPRACAVCGATFTPKARNRALYCSQGCKNRSPKNRERRLERVYGITVEDYDRMLDEQGGGCGICGRRPEEQKRYTRYLVVDHDHTTGEVRGLLCSEHNLLLGRLGDDARILRRALAYLEGGRQYAQE